MSLRIPRSRKRRSRAALRLRGGLLLFCICWAMGFPRAALAQDTAGEGSAPLAGQEAGEPFPLEELALAFASRMHPDEKVGQLFVVPVFGSRPWENEEILDLIRNYRIGGLVLNERNLNLDYRSESSAPLQVARLSNRLQAAALDILVPWQDGLAPAGVELSMPDPVMAGAEGIRLPLFLGLQLREEKRLESALRPGFTPQPSQLALGATWEPTFAEAMGTILGQELQAVGINLLLGPDLDIAGPAMPRSSDPLATAAFGGDSWWAGQHGRAFIGGVRDGSGGQVLVFARHFPGQGDRDRQPDEELSTVQGTLEDLRRHELVPFAAAAVTNGGHTSGSADGFVTSHVRFSGFLRSRERTPPVSMSDQLGEVLSLSDFAAWRTRGGLLLTDALGVPAVRRYYDPSGASFPAQRIAGEAFRAGNDLLWLERYVQDGDYGVVRQTIEFFQEQYREKPDFAEAVDRAVLRLLMAKLRVYPVLNALEQSGSEPGPAAMPDDAGFNPNDVLRSSEDMRVFAVESMNVKQSVVTRAAQGGVSLLYSNQDPEGVQPPSEPGIDDRLLIFTDARRPAACGACESSSILDPEHVQRAVLRYFGPGATRQIAPGRIASYTLADLSGLLNQSADAAFPSRLDRDLQNADWIVFAMLNVDGEAHPPSETLGMFLRQRPELAAKKQIAVLAFDAPYILDATDISKLTAYIGLYSPGAAYVETAVRALFRDLEFNGSPPVSVPGTRFGSLLSRLEPDPRQVIPVTLYDEKRSDFGLELFNVHLGDTITIQAGPILDRNGNPVPDGTPVQFHLKYSGSGLDLRTEPVPSAAGYGLVEVLLDRTELLEVAASSIDSRSSVKLHIQVEEQEAARITSVEPPPATAPAVPSDLPEESSVVLDQAGPVFGLNFSAFALTHLAMAILIAGYAVLSRRRRSPFLTVRHALWAAIAGMSIFVVAGFAAPLAPDGLREPYQPFVLGLCAAVVLLLLVLSHFQAGSGVSPAAGEPAD